MSSLYKAAIIGCGGIARGHANGYANTDGCQLAACADIQEETARTFAAEYNIPSYYTDYREMMERERPDLVSVCTHHHLHCELTLGAAAFKPKAIYCEKPIALHLQDADRMIAACERNGVLLVVGHQRRYGPQYTKAKELLDLGLIGRLVQMECFAHPWTSLLVDGTHSIDLLRYYNQDMPIDWVIGQVDTKAGSFRFGHPNEGSSLSMFGFKNGVRATLTTGGFSVSRSDYPAKDAESLGAFVSPRGYHKIRLYGTKGHIEIDGDDEVDGQPIVRIHRGEDVEAINVEFKSFSTIRSVIADILASLEKGKIHILNAHSGRAALELISAIFQSSKERTLVYLPLSLSTNPLYDIVSGQNPK